LSYDGVDYKNLEHKLTKQQIETYNSIARAWQIILSNIESALELTSGNKDSKARSAARSQFWGSQQRFFNQILTAMQMPSVVESIKKDLENGDAVVLQLVNTNEASQERAIGNLEESGQELEDLDLTPREYRQILSKLRTYLKVVEKQMSSNQWDEIEYSKVPSKAMTNYRCAFQKHSEEKFTQYIEDLKQNKTKVNASTLYPYDIMEKMELEYSSSSEYSRYNTFTLENYDELLEQQWKSLPNYVDGENNILIMADTSGSMCGRPIATSIGLALYFAERNKGFYNNKFITFSEEPSFVELKGNNLSEKVRCIPNIISSTNLEKAFKLVLDSAIQSKLKQEDMPKAIIVISDMQFNIQTQDSNMTWHDAMEKMFNDNGYNMPNIIYWNVNDYGNSYQVTSEYKNVQLASGSSVSTFKAILNNIDKTPYEAMVSILNDKAYACVQI
jgi:hypothetical protein